MRSYLSILTLLVACITKEEIEEFDQEFCQSAVDNFLFDCDHDGFGIPIVATDCEGADFRTLLEDCGVNIEDYPAEFDCDDTNGESPALMYADADGDGFGGNGGAQELICGDQTDYSLSSDDCDDTNSAINPSAPEECDGEDQDCDGEVDEDWEC